MIGILLLAPCIKVCIKCNTHLLETGEYFNFRDKKKGLLRPDCKKCQSIYRKEYHKNHKKEHKEWSEAYYKEYILREGVREKRCENTHNWYKKNIDHVKEYDKEYLLKNPNYRIDYNKKK